MGPEIGFGSVVALPNVVTCKRYLETLYIRRIDTKGTARLAHNAMTRCVSYLRDPKECGFVFHNITEVTILTELALEIYVAEEKTPYDELIAKQVLTLASKLSTRPAESFGKETYQKMSKLIISAGWSLIDDHCMDLVHMTRILAKMVFDLWEQDQQLFAMEGFVHFMQEEKLEEAFVDTINLHERRYEMLNWFKDLLEAAETMGARFDPYKTEAIVQQFRDEIQEPEFSLIPNPWETEEKNSLRIDLMAEEITEEELDHLHQISSGIDTAEEVEELHKAMGGLQIIPESDEEEEEDDEVGHMNKLLKDINDVITHNTREELIEKNLNALGTIGMLPSMYRKLPEEARNPAFLKEVQLFLDAVGYNGKWEDFDEEDEKAILDMYHNRGSKKERLRQIDEDQTLDEYEKEWRKGDELGIPPEYRSRKVINMRIKDLERELRSGLPASPKP